MDLSIHRFKFREMGIEGKKITGIGNYKDNDPP